LKLKINRFVIWCRRVQLELLASLLDGDDAGAHAKGSLLLLRLTVHRGRHGRATWFHLAAVLEKKLSFLFSLNKRKQISSADFNR
jgi:hypothetical protein